LEEKIFWFEGEVRVNEDDPPMRNEWIFLKKS